MFSRSDELNLDARGLARRFGARWVLRGVTLQVRAGEAVGLTGSNGSGKSTLLRIVSTLLRPNAGTASVCGADLLTDGDGVRSRVGFFAHVPGLYDDLTARENLAFAADMLGRPRSAVDALLERVGLRAAAEERARGFSTGMQRRLSLARLLLVAPTLLLLDEPFNNLDAQGISLMRDVVRETTARGGSALIVLHDLASGSGILDRTVTLSEGRIAGEPGAGTLAPVAAGALA